MSVFDRMPAPARYVAGTLIVLAYVGLEVIAFFRLPRAERERLIDMALDALDHEPRGPRHGS